MKILLFTAIYPTKENSAIPSDTKAIHYFAREWEKKGDNVEVIYLYTNPLKKISIKTIRNIFKPKFSNYWYENVHVNLFEMQLLMPHTSNMLKFQMKRFEKAVYKKIKEFRNFVPDIIAMHFPMSFYKMRLPENFECPSIAIFHKCDMIETNRQKREEVIEYLKQFGKIGSRNKIIQNELLIQYGQQSELIYSGVSKELIKKEELVRNKKFLKNGICEIVYVGNLIALKNVDILLKSVAQLEFDVRVNIVGSGIEENKLKKMCKELGIEEKVIFKGKLPREKAVECMEKADIFVMVSSPETFGLVYLEAMAQGTITIGSKNEGIDGVIINNYNGFLVTAGSIEELSSLLNKIYNLSEEEKKRISSNGYRTACEMTDSKMAEKYLNLIVEDKKKETNT